MSKLSESIERELQKREKEQQEKERAEERRKDIITQQKIQEIFNEELKKCLAILRPFEKAIVPVGTLKNYFRLEENAEDLGFLIGRNDWINGRDSYVFYVPKIENGESKNMKWAQKKLKDFELELEEAQEKRKKELMDEYEKVKQKLLKGEFESNGNIIYVQAGQTIMDTYEEKIIKSLFKKDEIEFCAQSGNQWRLMLQS